MRNSYEIRTKFVRNSYEIRTNFVRISCELRTNLAPFLQDTGRRATPTPPMHVPESPHSHTFPYTCPPGTHTHIQCSNVHTHTHRTCCCCCMKSKVPPLHMGDPLNTWGIYRCGPWGQRPPTHSWVVPIEKPPAHMGDPLITWGIYSILSATCVLYCTRHAPHMPHPLCFPWLTLCCTVCPFLCLFCFFF